MSFRTGQERVDSLTMAITNPNVVGSGYIEHPPQRPFQDRIMVQPQTVKPDDIPDWYDAQGVLHHGPRPAGYTGGRGPQGYAPRGGYGTGRGYQQAPQRGGGVPGYHPAPQQQRQPQYRPAPQQQPRPEPQQQPRPMAPPPQPRPHYGAPTAPGVYDTSSLMNTLQQPAPAPVPVPHRPVAPVPVAAPVAAFAAPAPAPVADEAAEEKKLSKSAKAKLRKKMREGKA